MLSAKKQIHRIPDFSGIGVSFIPAVSGASAVFLNTNDKTYIQPDISVICDKSKLDDRGCNGAPDFIIEIVSLSSRKMDYTTKNALYSDAGVREYWIVDPEKQRTTIYRYEEDVAPMTLPFQQNITVGIYSDLNINIAELLK